MRRFIRAGAFNLNLAVESNVLIPFCAERVYVNENTFLVIEDAFKAFNQFTLNQGEISRTKIREWSHTFINTCIKYLKTRVKEKRKLVNGEQLWVAVGIGLIPSEAPSFNNLATSDGVAHDVWVHMAGKDVYEPEVESLHMDNPLHVDKDNKVSGFNRM